MCQVCDYIIFRLQQELDLAKSKREADKFDVLNDLLTDAELARWATKEGLTYPPKVEPSEAEKEADRRIVRERK